MIVIAPQNRPIARRPYLRQMTLGTNMPLQRYGCQNPISVFDRWGYRSLGYVTLGAKVVVWCDGGQSPAVAAKKVRDRQG